MRDGKDATVEEPGVIIAEQLPVVRQARSKAGPIWSVDSSERFEVKAMTRATELVQAGALGRVVETIGLGPIRRSRHLGLPWFFERAKGGGILADIGSRPDRRVLHSRARAMPDRDECGRQ